MAQHVPLFEQRRRFVEVWQMSHTLCEVCETLGIDRRDASNIAAFFRVRGVKLKRFRSVRSSPALQVQMTPEEWHMLRVTADTWGEVWKKQGRREYEKEVVR